MQPPSSSSQIGIDPVAEHGDARVHARIAHLRASNAPRDHADQLALQRQRATGVALARVAAALLEAGAQHLRRDQIALPRVALRLRDNRHLHGQQHRRAGLRVLVQRAPAGDGGQRIGGNAGTMRRQRNGGNAGGRQIQAGRQPDHADVVVRGAGAETVVGVVDDALDASRLAAGGVVVAAGAHRVVLGGLLGAVGGTEQPIGGDDAGAANVTGLCAELQGDDPRVAGDLGDLTADDAIVEGRIDKGAVEGQGCKTEGGGGGGWRRLGAIHIVN